MIRNDDEDFVDTYGTYMAGGSVGGIFVGQPKGWKPPVREFNIGFHVAAPGPSHPDPATPPRPPRKPRAKPLPKSTPRKAKA